MDWDSNNRVPSLVQICQRVAIANVELIGSLGDGAPYPIIEPVLKECDPDQLAQLEEGSPHIKADTSEIWKTLCFRKYPNELKRHSPGNLEEPECWRDHYYFLGRAEAKRLEEVGIKLRSQRQEADERKKEREVKITDRVPPPKRPRTSGWPVNVQPKTLFQKTRTEASKIQKAMYHARILPPMPTSKTFRVLPKPTVATLLPPSGTQPNRVKVNTVTQPRSSAASHLSPSLVSAVCSKTVPISTHTSSSRSSSTSNESTSAPRIPCTVTPTQKEPSTNAAPSPSPAQPNSRPPKSVSPVKRDPMAALFVPKRRAYSQRPA